MASLIENLKSWFAPPAPPPVRNQGYHHLTGEIFGESLPQAGLPALNERSALAISAVYAAVNLIAGTIATMPVQVYARQADGERDRLHNDDLWWILNEEMTPRWNAAAGWEHLGQSLLLRGDAFLRIRRNPMGRVLGLEPLAYDRVRPLVQPPGDRLIYEISPDPLLPSRAAGKLEVIDQDDMIHVPGFGFNGLQGLSPLRHALRLAAPVASAMQEYSARFFSNGARPDYVLTTDQGLSPAAIDQLREQIQEAHGGLAKSRKPMLLTNGLKTAPLSLPADEMQLLESRKFAVEEIARIYGVPPFMIGHNEKTTSWGSGVEAMGVGFVRYTLRQHLNKIEGELNRKLIRGPRKVLAFDTTDLERADFKTLLDGFRIALGRAGEPAFMTVEEVRERLSLKRQPATPFPAQAPAPAVPDPTEPSPAPAPDPQTDGAA
ncbi:phage portal protein [Phenylobacterium sp.]|uniref:phage portal protein n=1 Tax=Phenylobacterium sp. TaxID=1871053 RepID=UPI0025CE2026|nr:phage portal protein [Phenylobacterium sp.]MCA3711327.1 phage portal protein [Phenylobacterium sp.]MCA3716484.1 phage portal protein [Phenylobacterium sp.]MCA6239180.1 phage portal protein [Phenylobacterium sp.]